MNRGQVVAAFVVLLLVMPGVAAGSTSGSPDIDVTLPKNTVAAGEEATLRLSLTNDADLDTVSLTNPTLSQRVTTASAVTVAMESGDAPVTVETRRQSVGSIPDGATMPVAFDVSVDADAAPEPTDCRSSSSTRTPPSSPNSPASSTRRPSANACRSPSGSRTRPGSRSSTSPRTSAPEARERCR
ncbi:hypothetical protein ACFQH6_10950 [Halobacteriaceae archaeon GCM10025711]